MLAHEHSGKVRHHSHTSYAGLMFALVVVGILLLGSSWAANAAPPAVNPQAGSVGLTGTVKGPPPSTAAVIVSPRDNSRTSSIPITISGTCPLNTFISIFKNDVFGGVTACQDDGTFSLLVDLFDGANTLRAQVTDAIGQTGPDSNMVHVFYDSPALNTPGGAVGQQLFLEVNTTVLGTDPNQPTSRTVTIVGGNGPYAVSWDWGDGENTLASQEVAGPVTSSHAYKAAGTYRVVVRVTDSQNNSAYMQLITVVNGSITPTGATRGDGLGALSGNLLAAWPLYVLAFLMVVFFWLGERREIHKLRKREREAALS
jgi:hypothetical protein